MENATYEHASEERIRFGNQRSGRDENNRSEHYTTCLALWLWSCMLFRGCITYSANIRKRIGGTRSWRADRLRSSTKHDLCLGITRVSGDMIMVVYVYVSH